MHASRLVGMVVLGAAAVGLSFAGSCSGGKRGDGTAGGDVQVAVHDLKCDESYCLCVEVEGHPREEYCRMNYCEGGLLYEGGDAECVFDTGDPADAGDPGLPYDSGFPGEPGFPDDAGLPSGPNDPGDSGLPAGLPECTSKDTFGMSVVSLSVRPKWAQPGDTVVVTGWVRAETACVAHGQLAIDDGNNHKLTVRTRSGATADHQRFENLQFLPGNTTKLQWSPIILDGTLPGSYSLNLKLFRPSDGQEVHGMDHRTRDALTIGGGGGLSLPPSCTSSSGIKVKTVAASKYVAYWGDAVRIEATVTSAERCVGNVTMALDDGSRRLRVVNADGEIADAKRTSGRIFSPAQLTKLVWNFTVPPGAPWGPYRFNLRVFEKDSWTKLAKDHFQPRGWFRVTIKI